MYAARCPPLGVDHPRAALYRDRLAMAGHLVGGRSSADAARSEHAVQSYARQQLDGLEAVVQQQRRTHAKLIGAMHQSEERHKQLLHELDDERKKHERDTAHGDDITYGLEVERTRLRQDLDAERLTTKRLEREARKMQESIDAEQMRQKTIVVLLLAERKRIISKYMEEQKRSQDLGQILSEEKLRSDSIARGLEEESQRSLRLEAELERQLHAVAEQKNELGIALADRDMRCVLVRVGKWLGWSDYRGSSTLNCLMFVYLFGLIACLVGFCRNLELEQEVAQLRAENEFYRKQQGVTQQRIAAGPPQLPQKSGRLNQGMVDQFFL